MPAAIDRIWMESKTIVDQFRTTTRVPILVPRHAAGTRKQSMPVYARRFKTMAILGTALLAIVATGVLYRSWQGERLISAAESHGAEHAKAVTVTSPTPASTSNVVLPATFRAWQSAALYARANGYLTAWHFDLGSPVKAGDVLAEIETPELDQEVAQAEASASEAAAAAVQAQAEGIEAQSELKVAEAQLARVQAEYELSRSQLVRRDSLAKTRSISQEEYDTFQRQVEARVAEVNAARSDVARRRTNLDTRAAIVQARLATAQSRRANVDRLKELQAFKRIVAPFDGAITSRTAEVGMLVTAGKEPLFVIEDLSRIRVQINVPQTYAMQTIPGVAATVSLPESNSPRVAAQITRIADSVDATSRTMLAEIELENTITHFQPGSYAQVTLAAPQSATQWTIPTNTIAMRSNGSHIVVVNDQNQIEIKRVSLGRDLGDRVVVADGIHGNERLVVNPNEDLVDGLAVQMNGGNKSVDNLARAESSSHQITEARDHNAE
jgi:RND family efflux transporter MFP subunit